MVKFTFSYLLIISINTSFLVSAICTDNSQGVIVTKEKSQNKNDQLKIKPQQELRSKRDSLTSSSMILNDRMYKYVEDAVKQQGKTTITQNVSKEKTGKREIITQTDVKDNRLIEYSNDGFSTSVEIPEDILVKMGKLEPQEFIKYYVEDDPNSVNKNDQSDDLAETSSSSSSSSGNSNGNSDGNEDDITISMLMRGYNSGDSDSTTAAAGGGGTASASSTHLANGKLKR